MPSVTIRVWVIEHISALWRPTHSMHPLFTEHTDLYPCALDELNPDKEKIMEQNAQQAQKEKIMEQNAKPSENATSRRSFLRKGLAVGGAGALGAGLLTNGLPAFAKEASGGLTKGDVAILRFLSAAEIIETDLWQQYNELGGIQDSEVPGGSGSPGYIAALEVLDEDMPQYIHDNTEDEISHFTFINAYLASKGADPVNLDQFRTLQGSTADGAADTPRLTNLMQLTVDTSFWTRYRSRDNKVYFGQKFDASPISNSGTGVAPDPNDFLKLIYSKSDVPGSGSNPTSYVNPDVDKLIEQGRTVSGCSHMSVFMAGANTTGRATSHARQTHVRQLSASPAASLASVFASSGAITNRSAQRRSSMCNMESSRR